MEARREIKRSNRGRRQTREMRLGRFPRGWKRVGLAVIRRGGGEAVLVARAFLRLGEVEHAQQLLGEHEILGAKHLIGAGIIEVGEHDFGVDEQLAIEERLGIDDGALGAQVGEGDLVNELIAGAGDAEKFRAWNFGEHDFFRETGGFADQDTAGLSQAFDDERGRHDRVAWQVVVQVLFGEGDIFHGPGELAGTEFQELVYPDPAHAMSPSSVPNRTMGCLESRGFRVKAGCVIGWDHAGDPTQRWIQTVAVAWSLLETYWTRVSTV